MSGAEIGIVVAERRSNRTGLFDPDGPTRTKRSGARMAAASSAITASGAGKAMKLLHSGYVERAAIRHRY
jgi:hypothetical protein